MVGEPLLLIEMSRKAKVFFRNFPCVFYRAGWKELIELMNSLSSYFLDEAVPTQSSVKRL